MSKMSYIMQFMAFQWRGLLWYLSLSQMALRSLPIWRVLLLKIRTEENNYFNSRNNYAKTETSESLINKRVNIVSSISSLILSDSWGPSRHSLTCRKYIYCSMWADNFFKKKILLRNLFQGGNGFLSMLIFSTLAPPK